MPLTMAAGYFSPDTLIRPQGPVGCACRARLTEIDSPYPSTCTDVKHPWSVLGDRREVEHTYGFFDQSIIDALWIKRYKPYMML